LGFPPLASGWSLDTSDRSPILELDPDREIVSIDIECDVDILRMQIWTSRIVKAPNLATGQDEATNSVCIVRSAFKSVAKVDGAEFVFVGSLQPIIAIATREI
jgi:hypothetical protein